MTSNRYTSEPGKTIKMNMFNETSQMHSKSNEKGQAIIVLILVMLVALTIGLAISQRSLTSIQVSTRTEQTSRAFSAAEAGLELALESGDSNFTISTPRTLGNDASLQVRSSGDLPGPGQAHENPPFTKAELVQFWLANPSTPALTGFYAQPSFYIYFGNADPNPQKGEEGYSVAENPAVEVNAVTRVGSNYSANRSYFDSDNARDNGFLKETETADLDCRIGSTYFYINTSLSPDSTTADRSFLCRALVRIPAGSEGVLVRVRLLYSNNKQRVAIARNCTVGGNCNFPAQSVIYTARGRSGETERQVQATITRKVAPHLLDFVIYSAGDLNK